MFIPRYPGPLDGFLISKPSEIMVLTLNTEMFINGDFNY